MTARLARTLALSAAALAWAAPSRGASTEGPLEPAAADTPASRYGKLDRPGCEAELRKRNVPFTVVDAARGVAAPLRLTGPLHGVTFHSPLPPTKRESSPLEIVDCRLVLALDDLAGILARHDVVEVVHLSMYRPPSRAARAKRHGAALAIDAATFVKRDGSTLEVDRDFHGRLGVRPCGERAVLAPVTPAATELRKVVCEVVDAHLFHVALTPGFNRQHKNHLHLEVSPEGRWFYVR